MERLLERFISVGSMVEASKAKLPDGVLCIAKYQICSMGERNRNNRIYEEAVWDRVLEDAEVQEKLKNRSLFFHAEHPEESQSNTEKVAGIVSEIQVDKPAKKVYAIMEVLDTPYGRIVDTLLKAGCGIGVSTRADGELEECMDEDGSSYSRVVPEAYRFITVDFTADPSSYGSELPLEVQRGVTKVVKEDLDNEKIDRAFATSLLEHIDISEAKTILESLKMDRCHSGCGCKVTEKHCLECSRKDEALSVDEEGNKKKTVGSYEIEIWDGREEDGNWTVYISHYDNAGKHEIESQNVDSLEDAEKVFQQYIKQAEELNQEVVETVVKKGDKWQVQSHSGKNMGTYDTKEEAEKRLGQVEYFKHKNESIKQNPAVVIDGKTYKIFRSEFAVAELGDEENKTSIHDLPLDVKKKVTKRLEEMTEEEAEELTAAVANATDIAKNAEGSVRVTEASNIKKWQKRAQDYYSRINYVPDQQDIYDFIAGAIADETGMSYEDAFSMVEKELGELEEACGCKDKMVKEAGYDYVYMHNLIRMMKNKGYGPTKAKKVLTGSGVDDETAAEQVALVYKEDLNATRESVLAFANLLEDRTPVELKQLMKDYYKDVRTPHGEVEEPMTHREAIKHLALVTMRSEKEVEKILRENTEVSEKVIGVHAKNVKAGQKVMIYDDEYKVQDVEFHPEEKEYTVTFSNGEQVDLEPNEILSVIKEDTRIAISADGQISQYLADNWDNFENDQDAVDNLVATFKINGQKAKEYVKKQQQGDGKLVASYAIEKKLKENYIKDALFYGKNLKKLEEQTRKSSQLLEQASVELEGKIEENKQLTAKLEATSGKNSELTEKLKASDKILKETKEKLEKEISSLKEKHKKQLVETYTSTKIKCMGLKLSEKGLTLLGLCETTAEVDATIRQLQNAVTESALQFSGIQGIEVTETVKTDPVQEGIDRKVDKAMSAWTGKPQIK